LESPVAGVFFLICGLVTGGFLFSGGVSARDSGWHPSFFGGLDFLPLGAMVKEGGVPQGGVNRRRRAVRGREEKLLY